MAIFTIYRYKFEPLDGKQPSIPGDEEYQRHSTYKSQESLFESFFGKAEDIIPGIKEIKKKEKGKVSSVEAEEHVCKIKQHKDNIIILRLKANKTKTVETQDDSTMNIGHHPGSLILIDNRKGYHLIAVERNTAVFSDSDKVVSIIQEAFNSKMNEYGLSIKIELLTKKKDFWEAVNEIRSKLRDSVTSVKFDFKSKEKEDGKGRIHDLINWLSLFAKDSSLSMNIENDENLKKVKTDLDNMADLCQQNSDYHLTVKFRDFGLFRFGQDMKAQYGLEDKVIEHFVSPRPTEPSLFNDLFYDNDITDMSLSQWFDKINILFADYEKVAPVGRTRNTRGRV